MSMTPSGAQAAGRIFYVDCTSLAHGSGVLHSPWNDLATVNAATFEPADIIKFRRGTACRGSLSPHGSGTKGAVIRITAYGEGLRPRIIAPSSAEESFHLFNQQYWDIDSLDLAGGGTYGVFISGDTGILHHIHLSNLDVHDVIGGPVKHKESGLVSISPSSSNEHFDDVLVDGVSAWNTNQWVGILVGGGNVGYPPEDDWNSNVIIRNSSIHDVQGDGIVLFRVRKGLIDSTVAWNTGMQVTESIGTPNAIWTWMCTDCIVRNSEAYLTDSPGVDGGAFDIDYGNTRNSVIDNYGHDTQGYCIAVFGAGFVTHESVVRGNLCINNGRSPRMAKYQGAMFLLSWNGGSIDGLTVQDNTIYYRPFEDSAVIVNDAKIKTGTATFQNNIIYSTSPWMVRSNEFLDFTKNRYNYYGVGSAKWKYKTSNFGTLDQLQSGTSQEVGSQFSEFPLSAWSELIEKRIVEEGHSSSYRLTESRWRLECSVPVWIDDRGLLNDSALQQLVTLESFAQQYKAQGLEVVVKLTSANRQIFQWEAFRNAQLDLHLDDVRTAVESAEYQQQTRLVLSGNVAKHWDGFTGPVVLGLALRQAMGEPVYAQMGKGSHE
jgi:hypothetical protein